MLERLSECVRRWGWQCEGVTWDALWRAWDDRARIGVLQEAGRADWWQPLDQLPTQLLPLVDWSELARVDFLVLISDRLVPVPPSLPTLTLRPRTLTLALSGPDTGEVAQLDQAVRSFCQEHGLAFASLTAIATIEGDPGQALFEEWADLQDMPILPYANSRLAQLRRYLGISSAAEPSWQTEAAAMLAASSQQLVVPACQRGPWCMAIARRQTG